MFRSNYLRCLRGPFGYRWLLPVFLFASLFLIGCSHTDNPSPAPTSPTANAGGPYTGVVGTSVTFDGSKSAAPSGQTLSYSWNFGDNSSGTGVNPTHAYTTAGSFTATLTLIASGGGTATSTAAVTITATQLPVANAGGPYNGVVGTAITFDGSKSTAPNGQTLTYAWNFGDNTTGSGVSPTHTYTSVGSYTVTLTVTSSGGATATSTAPVTITAVPVPIANAGGPYTGVLATPVSLDGSKSTVPAGQTLTYAWNFGDNSTGSGVNPSHSYASIGTFTATLTVTASGGATATSTATVTITAAPVPVANAGGPYAGVVGTAVSFDGSKSTAPSGQTLSYAWDFGDSVTGSGVNPGHTYASAGSFTATLKVTASGGGTATSTATVGITAVPVPVANAGGPYTGAVGTAIAFDGSKSTAPTGQTLSYAWNFGDGSSGTGVNPAHSYAMTGTFTATLTVMASGGTTATSTAAVIITTVPMPVANAGGPYTGVVGTAVSFDGSMSAVPSGQTLTYSWNFGDNSIGTGVNPTHTYAAAGSFTATLTVTASSGATATATAAVAITATPVPVANAGGPYTGAVAIAISFDGSKSTAPTGQTLTYSWNFGDNSNGTGVNPTHSYAAAGSFTVTLMVTASGGATATSTATVTITAVPLPVANAGGPYTGIVGTAITFDGSKSKAPTGQTLSYAWNFGDNSTGSGVSPTHSYASANIVTATLIVTASGGGTATSTAPVTITEAPVPVANPGGPYTGVVGTAVTFDGSKSSAPAGQTLSYAWNFGDSSSGSGVSPTHAYATAGSFTATLVVTASGGATSMSTAPVTISLTAPTISGFAPASGPVGTVVTVAGSNLVSQSGSVTQVSLAQQGGGSIQAPVSAVNASNLSFVIPPGAATGAITVSVGTASVSSSSVLTVTTSSSFTVAVTPGTGTVIQGQSTSLAISISSTSSFPGVANLTVSGLPSGVTASFQPSSVAVGQTALLNITAPSGQAAGTANLVISAGSTVDGQPISQTANASLNVKAITTTFLGRTVVDDAAQEPLAGVTVTFTGMDDKGNHTGCSGSTVSDGGGNFMLSNLPTACIGPQLISYNGLTVTSPAGQYAGVNLSYTLVSAQVVSSPALIHLPRIDNAETVQVQQNSITDQIFYFHSIPGVKVTVYAGTTLSLDDGSQPNPFPLVAISIPLDRLPEKMPTSGMLMPFIVAFQPANAVASQPVAVNFPNSLGVAPNANVMFVTLDPTHGYMVPYGTGTVSNDGTEFVADPDPNHPGHAYGLVHFDWHGPATNSNNSNNPGGDGGGGGGCPGSSGSSAGSGGGGGGPAPGACMVGGPVDVASGIVTYKTTDISIGGQRGGLSITRIYRTLTSNSGLFGRGTSDPYSMYLNTISLLDGQALVSLVMPDGNQFPMSQAPDGTFSNTTIPALRGAVLSGSIASNVFNLKWLDGSLYKFQIYPALGAGQAFLTAMTDLNGNTTTLTLNASAPQQVLKVTDPVGRSLNLTYDSFNRVTQVLDPIGRKLLYTYNTTGTLATFTDANGGVTKYTYDASNNLASITDPRGIVTEQNTYNESFDGRITQQVEADGGIFKFAYTLQNPNVATSPVLQTIVTDPLGHQTTYRFNTQSFLVSATDASGQTRTLTRDPNHSNLVSDYTGNGTCPVCGNPAAGDIHYTFDGLGNVLTVTNALGNKTSFTYDTRFNRANSIIDALGNTTKIVYDANSNPITVTDANGNTTQTTYDAFGEPTQTVDPTGAKTTIAYDSFGNIASVTNALGNTTNLSYDGAGRLTQVQDALGRKGLTAYDALDRVVRITDPSNNMTQLAYDAVGNLLSLTDPKGNATAFAYDSRQRLIARTDPLKRQQSYQYDVNSNLTQFTDRRGQVSKFAYDTLDRQTTATYQDSTVGHVFDSAGRLLTVNDSMDGVFTFKYDAVGRLLQQGEPTGVVQYTRDALGRVATKGVVGQAMTSYTYDSTGNMLTAGMPGLGVTSAYDKRNLPLTLSRTNGVLSTYSFDAIGELLLLVHAKGATALNTQVYTYDKVGKRSAVQNDLSEPLKTSSTSNSTNADNQLITSSTTAFTYDENGNRLTETSSSGKATFSWDSRNRLTSTTNPDGTSVAMRYGYGHDLLEIDRNSVGSVSTQRFVVDASTNVVSITNNAGSQLSVLTTQGLDSHVGSADTAGNVAFGLVDALGSGVAVTGSDGTVQSNLSYQPYGLTLGAPPSVFPFAYAGRVAVNGNLYYNRNRFYDSENGVFLAEDPLGNGLGGQSLYAYGDDDPVDYNDPDGMVGRSTSSRIISIITDRYLPKAIDKYTEDTLDDLQDDVIKKTVEALGCATGLNGLGKVVNAGRDLYGAFKANKDLVQATELLELAALTGNPIFIGAAAIYEGYEFYKTVKSDYDAIKGVSEVFSEESPKCGCGAQP